MPDQTSQSQPRTRSYILAWFIAGVALILAMLLAKVLFLYSWAVPMTNMPSVNYWGGRVGLPILFSLASLLVFIGVYRGLFPTLIIRKTLIYLSTVGLFIFVWYN